MSSDKSVFEPRIVAFLCNWCSYTGADLAGTARMKYPANVRTIRVMCSGRVDAQFVMKAFAEGADAVLISGCHTPSDCHYQEGNFKALRRYYLLKKMLPQFGIEPERLRLEWISAAEGDKFQEVCTEYTEQIKKLGPSPVKKGVKNG
jgi:F420-non-reducing hydrogenase iron-sulfur subunit